MLDNAGGEVGVLGGVQVALWLWTKPLALDPLVALHLGVDAGPAQALLMLVGQLTVAGLPLGVDHDKPVVAIPDRDDPLHPAYLIGGKSEATGAGGPPVLCGVDQVFNNVLD